MRRSRAVAVAALLFLVSLLLVGGIAIGAVCAIEFNEQPMDTEISTQYQAAGEWPRPAELFSLTARVDVV